MAFNKFYLHLIRYGFYLIFWHLFEGCKNVYRNLFKGESKIPSNQARIHKILFRHKLSAGEVTRREDFITTDAGFIFIDDLKGSNWTVYSLDKKKAIFVEMPKPISEYSINKCPFIYPHLFEECIQIAEIDLSTYFSLADKFESESNYKPPKCLLFTNAARSASTLFGSMLHRKNYTTVFGEHPALTTIAVGLCQGYWNENDVSRLLNPTIKILRKNIPSNHLLILKTRSIETILVPFISKEFPKIQHIFMFRKNGLESVEKLVSLGGTLYIFMCQMYIHFPSLTKILTSLIWDTIKELKPKTNLEAAMIIYAEPYFYYKKNKSLYNFPIVWQDELISTPEKVLALIFDKLNIPESCIPAALDRMKYDSQDGTFLSQEIMKKHSSTSKITPELKQKILGYAKRFQMEPRILGFHTDDN